ncbi:hypothetical protein [Siminovitchia sp. 179-K 8D1 HS]|uniref:hypothetical protein n=1 Tax=Siminovitchia sp. 179-K 8D1 HS TaxID=3142385 RepID=UPI0039A2A28E
MAKDKKFVTAGHNLQSIWEVGLAGPKQKKMVVKQLADRFIRCMSVVRKLPPQSVQEVIKTLEAWESSVEKVR